MAFLSSVFDIGLIVKQCIGQHLSHIAAHDPTTNLAPSRYNILQQVEVVEINQQQCVKGGHYSTFFLVNTPM